jgi:hypothetical protein
MRMLVSRFGAMFGFIECAPKALVQILGDSELVAEKLSSLAFLLALFRQTHVRPLHAVGL